MTITPGKIQFDTRRSVDEWVGSTPDAKIPDRVRLRVFERYGGICQLTKRKIRAGDSWDVDHIKRLRDGGQHRETNLWPVLTEAHREKSARETRDGSKADRIKKKHFGLYPPSPTPLKSRNTFRRRG